MNHDNFAKKRQTERCLMTPCLDQGPGMVVNTTMTARTDD